MNHCWTLRKREAGSNLVDMGRYAVHDDHDLWLWLLTPKPSSSVGGEVTLKDYGVGVAMLPG